MKITMKSLYASPEGALHPGQTADVKPALAKALIDGGYAVAGEDEYSPDDANKANAKASARRGGRPSTKRGRGAQTGDDTGDGDGQGDDGTGTGDGNGNDGDTGGDGDGQKDGQGGDGEQGAGTTEPSKD